MTNSQEKRYIHICTKEDPWTEEKSDRAQHSNAELIHTGDYRDTYKCPNCGLTFSVELPE